METRLNTIHLPEVVFETINALIAQLLVGAETTTKKRDPVRIQHVTKLIPPISRFSEVLRSGEQKNTILMSIVWSGGQEIWQQSRNKLHGG